MQKTWLIPPGFLYSVNLGLLSTPRTQLIYVIICQVSILFCFHLHVCPACKNHWEEFVSLILLSYALT